MFDFENKSLEGQAGTALAEGGAGDTQNQQADQQGQQQGDGTQQAADAAAQQAAQDQQGAASGDNNPQQGAGQQAGQQAEGKTYSQEEFSKMQSSFATQVNAVRADAERQVSEARQELKEGLDAAINAVNMLMKNAVGEDGQQLQMPQEIADWQTKAQNNDQARTVQSQNRALAEAVNDALVKEGIDPNDPNGVKPALLEAAQGIANGTKSQAHLWAVVNKAIIDKRTGAVTTDMQKLREELTAKLTPEIAKQVLKDQGITQQDLGAGSGAQLTEIQTLEKANDDFNYGRINETKYKEILAKLKV